MNTMLDVAKVADLVLLLVDASFGFEMDTFEFLNILQVTHYSSLATYEYLVSPLSASGAWLSQGDGCPDPPGHVPLSKDTEKDKEEAQEQILD